ncbi:hypothetical protein KDRO_E01600 [Kluyveromyces lactis]|nr:hypothetical protein KDRO_E01600 [Kluyveromyces lactis]
METLLEKDLPEGKEERIRLALDFIREQHSKEGTDNSEHDNKPKKDVLKLSKYGKKRRPTIRQIALHFQIPKSTLYDRMKADQGQKRQRTITKANTAAGQSDESSGENNEQDLQMQLGNQTTKTYTHLSQMRFSPEAESDMVRNMQGYVLAYGNLPLISDLRECIPSPTRAVHLGNKWITGFIRRHGEETIYGTMGEGVLNAKFKDFRQWKNKFSQLHDLFLPRLQSKLKRCDQFHYVCKYVPHGSNKANKMIFFALKVKIQQINAGTEKDVTISWLCEPITRELSPISPEEAKEQFLQDLNSILKHIDAKSTDLVVLEGLTQTEHWDWSQCLELVKMYKLNGKLYTVPWGNDLLTNCLNKDNNIAATFEKISQDSNSAVATKDMVNFASVSVMLKEIITNATPLPAVAANESLTQRDAIRQLIRTISENESRLYREIQDPDARVTLCNIFNQARLLEDSLSTCAVQPT